MGSIHSVSRDADIPEGVSCSGHTVCERQIQNGNLSLLTLSTVFPKHCKKEALWAGEGTISKTLDA